MSLAQHILNRYLRLTEKPHLARATPEKMRSSMEAKARLLFWPPRGTRYFPTVLAHGDNSLSALTIDAPTDQNGPLILYFHGGGYVFGSPDTHKAMLARLAQRARQLGGLVITAPKQPRAVNWHRDNHCIQLHQGRSRARQSLAML